MIKAFGRLHGSRLMYGYSPMLENIHSYDTLFIKVTSGYKGPQGKVHFKILGSCSMLEMILRLCDKREEGEAGETGHNKYNKVPWST